MFAKLWRKALTIRDLALFFVEQMFGLGKILLLAHLSPGCENQFRHNGRMTKTNSSSNAATKGSLLTDLHIKVPAVTAFFWIIKVLATTVGETLADFLNSSLSAHLKLTDSQGLSYTSLIVTALTVFVLVAQFRASKYVPTIYWTLVVLISIAGTLITDNLTDNFGVALQTTTVIFSICLAIIFFAWHRVEGTLSIHSIRTPRRETFYWLTILFTFALGTAAGDLVNEKWATGYGRGLLLFGVVILVIAIAYRFGLNAVLSFWAVYVLTRPLGASLGDLLIQPKVVVADGAFPGFGIPKPLVNIVFAVVIVALVSYLTVSKADQITPEKFDDATK